LVIETSLHYDAQSEKTSKRKASQGTLRFGYFKPLYEESVHEHE